MSLMIACLAQMLDLPFSEDLLGLVRTALEASVSVPETRAYWARDPTQTDLRGNLSCNPWDDPRETVVDWHARIQKLRTYVRDPATGYSEEVVRDPADRVTLLQNWKGGVVLPTSRHPICRATVG